MATKTSTIEKPMEKTIEQQRWDQVVAELDKLAVGQYSTEEIRLGDGFTIPEQYGDDYIAAAHKIIEIAEAREQAQRFTKVLPYKKWDVLVALTSVFRKHFGTGITQLNSFFEIGQYKDIPVSVTETARVPFGRIVIPAFNGTMRVYGTNELGEESEEAKLYEGQDGAAILVDAPKKHEPRIIALWMLIENELKEHSIYRGKAINGSNDIPEFLDIREFDPKSVIYTAENQRQLEANLWAPIKFPQLTKEMGIDPSRKVLLAGPFGTGKTLTAKITAKLCEATERTFILCNPKDNDVFACLRMAAQYSQPQGAVLFVEDIDRLMSEADRNEIARLLDELDGFQSKGYNVMMVFTTNRVEEIHKGVLRPGRLDSVIEIGEYDLDATTRLFKLFFSPEKIDGVDFEELFNKMQGFTPAFTTEVCEKAKLYAVPKLAEGLPESYSTEDFLAVISEVRAQHNLHMEAPDTKERGSIDQNVEQIMQKSLHDALSHSRVVDPDMGLKAKVVHKQ